VKLPPGTTHILVSYNIYSTTAIRQIFTNLWFTNGTKDIKLYTICTIKYSTVEHSLKSMNKSELECTVPHVLILKC